MKSPLTSDFEIEGAKMKPKGLYDPESAETCIIFWIPYLFKNLLSYLNQAIINDDDSATNTQDLRNLGPFARVFHEVVYGCEEHRSDKLRPGLELAESSDLGNFNQMFFVYLGSCSSKQSIESWQQQIGIKTIN